MFKHAQRVWLRGINITLQLPEKTGKLSYTLLKLNRALIGVMVMMAIILWIFLIVILIKIALTTKMTFFKAWIQIFKIAKDHHCNWTVQNLFNVISAKTWVMVVITEHQEILNSLESLLVNNINKYHFI